MAVLDSRVNPMKKPMLYVDEYEFDQLLERETSSKEMETLNKKRLTRWEMDELFA